MISPGMVSVYVSLSAADFATRTEPSYRASTASPEVDVADFGRSVCQRGLLSARDLSHPATISLTSGVSRAPRVSAVARAGRT